MRKLSEEKLAAERERLELMKSYERQYEDSVLVCGIDEAGRGPLAVSYTHLTLPTIRLV